MSEPRFEDMPRRIQWLLMVEPFGSVELFFANVLWRERVKPTPERVGSAVTRLREELGINFPTPEALATLREYRANGNRWT